MGQIIRILFIASPQILSVSEYGDRWQEAHGTSCGKVLLSAMNGAQLKAYLRENQLEPRASESITSPEELKTELERTRMRGYAICQNELEEGITAIGAPVRNARGEVIAAIGASGPTARIPELRREEMILTITQIADTMSLDIAGQKF